ncbi:MAG: hypothetical protein ACI4RG_09890 [Huintestinicola sp.]
MNDKMFAEMKKIIAPLVCKCAVCGKQFTIPFFARERFRTTPSGKKVCSTECEEISRKGLKR